jgi:hypothetical protein
VASAGVVGSAAGAMAGRLSGFILGQRGGRPRRGGIG